MPSDEVGSKLPEYVSGKCGCGRIRRLHRTDRGYLCRYCENRPMHKPKRRRVLLSAQERIRRDAGVGA